MSNANNYKHFLKFGQKVFYDMQKNVSFTNEGKLKHINIIFL